MAKQIIGVSSIAPFRPKARIMRILGDELVSSEIVALIELVKNAYDADATRVLIRFDGLLGINQGSIEVIDNGNGMSLETIQKTWMEPATLFRKNRTKSQKYGRRVLGEKGIGRFASSRLANRLEVITRQEGASKELHVSFDWTQFDDDQKYLDEIEIQCNTSEPNNISSKGIIRELWSVDEDEENIGREITHGTILRMDGLRKSWKEPQIRTLQTSLSRLVSPFFRQEMVPNGDNFSIFIKLPPPFDGLSGLVESPEALEHPFYSAKGTVDEKGYYDLTFKLKGLDKEEHTAGQFILDEGLVSNAGAFFIELRVWELGRNLKDFAQEYDMAERDVRRLLDDAAGISVYRDGFRVLPYGEPKNDWLRLDIRRVNNPERISNNQIVGYVLISADSNPLLRDQSNREGLMEGEALDDLIELIKYVLVELEIRIIDIKKKKKMEKERLEKQLTDLENLRNNEIEQKDANIPSSPKMGLFAGFELKSLRNIIKERHPNDNELMAFVGARDKKIEIQLERVKEVLARYQRLSVLGNLIDRVLHGGRAPLSKIGNETLLGLRDIERQKINNLELIQKLNNRLNIIKIQSESLAMVFKKIEPFSGRKRGKPKRVSLKQEISNAFSVLDDEIAGIGVQVVLPENDILFLCDSSEIQEVIIILLDNSLYWLRKLSKKQIYKIEVQMKQNNEDEIEIIFSDSGPGVDPEILENIFDPYVSKKPDGTGLGLTIAGEIITEYYNGSLELLESGPLPGATFRIVLGRRA